eukprot:TRINITY_DN11875_c0_g1_i1.p1 TRINITY_DN11875_c0_g1~~TRINITY_DN11875_c0_g1_i1.p1  ORF type:complete len:1286 (+),score=247.62 TRINITY_DN11875_c0_g1_i1:119-3976(+)
MMRSNEGYLSKAHAQQVYKQSVQSKDRKSSIRTKSRDTTPPSLSNGSAVSLKKSPIDSSKETIKLSGILRHFPGCFDPQSLRISAVEKNIKEINSIPERYRMTETIFLSNNNISSLMGFSQFANLRTLSIANNLISDLEDIDQLHSCSQLHILNLEGNPITLIPNYRYHVIQKLPRLRLLDSKEVSVAERKLVSQVIKKEEMVLNMMFSNEMLILKLEKGIQKLRIHTELRSVVYGRVSILNRSDLPESDHLDVKIFLKQLGDEIIAEDQRHQILSILRGEVRKAYNMRAAAIAQSKSTTEKKPSVSELWDSAFSDVMLQQQQTIAKLLSILEEEKQMFSEFHRRFFEYDPYNTISRLRDQERNKQTLFQGEREGIIREFRDTIHQLIHDFQGDYTAQAQGYETRIHALQKQIQSLTETANAQINDAAHRHSSPPKQIQSSQHTHTQHTTTQHFHDVGGAKKSHTLSNQTSRIVPPSTTTNLSRSGNEASVQFDTRGNTSALLLASNLPPQQQEPVTPDTHSNRYSQPQQLFSKLVPHKPMLSMQQTLDEGSATQRVPNLVHQQGRISDPSEGGDSRFNGTSQPHGGPKVASLENMIFKLQADIDRRQQESVRLMETNRRLQERISTAPPKSRQNINFSARILENTQEYDSEDAWNAAEAAHELILKRKTFRALKWYVGLKRKQHLIEGNKNYFHKIRFFATWRRCLELKAIESSVCEKLKRNYLRFYLERWLSYIVQRRKKTALKLKADDHHEFNTVRSHFYRWRGVFIRHIHNTMECDERIRGIYNRSILSKSLRRWSSYISYRRSKREAKNFADHIFLANAFVKWRTNFAVRVADKEDPSIYPMGASRYIPAWVESSERAHLISSPSLRARVPHLAAIKVYFRNLLRRTFSSWKQTYIVNKCEREKIEESDSRKALITLRAWKLYTDQALVRQRKLDLAVKHYDDRIKHFQRRAFLLWKTHCANKKRHGVIIGTLQSQRNRMMLSKAISFWNGFVRNAYKAKLQEVTEKHDLLTKYIQEANEKGLQAGQENLSLIQQLHNLTSEHSQLKFASGERDKELNIVRRALEESESQVVTLQEEVNHYRLQEEELKIAMDRIIGQKQDEISNLHGKYETDIKAANKENESLSLQVRELQLKLQTLTSDLDNSQQKLAKLGQENEQKLNTAFEIAASLRTLVEEKDQLISSLQTEYSQLETQLASALSRNDKSSHDLARILGEKDSRLSEVEGLVITLQTQLNEMTAKHTEAMSQVTEKKCHDLALAIRGATFDRKGGIENSKLPQGR